MTMHERLMYKWIKMENNIRRTARFDPYGVRIDAPSSTPQVPKGVLPLPSQVVKISDVSESCPLSPHKYVIVKKISQCLLQNIHKAVNTAFQTGPVKPIAKSCLEMVVLNEDKTKVFSSSPLESWKELQEIIRDGLKTVGVKAFVEFETGNRFERVQYTFIQTTDKVGSNQVPHLDYQWESILLRKKQVPWVVHLPVTSSGSFLFSWNGPGNAESIHIPFGTMLLLHGDVVHVGGLP